MQFVTRKRDIVNFSSPQEMYDDYKNRSINGIQDYQSKMLDLYMKEGLDKSDVAIELPTGTGKTLIGLLIGEYRRRKFHERVVYVCPTKQLVYQTANYAIEKYGIKVVAFTGSKTEYVVEDKMKFTSGQAMAITNYSSIFNTNSFFEGTDVLIFDDAHSGEGYISANWTVELHREEGTAYYKLLEELKGILTEEQYDILTKKTVNQSDASWCDMIHNAKLHDKYLNIKNLLDVELQESKQRFPWSNIRDNLFACNIYLSWQAIIIRPYISPTLANNVFRDAKTRIYMSATLVESGELERAYGVEFIHRLPMVKDWKNKNIGRRFFMFPLASFREEETLRILCKIASRVDRGLIIVNDLESQKGIQNIFREGHIADTFNGHDIEKSKDPFIKNEHAFAIMANRFDGIDFPDDECRMLILFDLPAATNIQEKFMITRLAARALFEERIKTRLIQALGRCTRSQTDYAAICIMGDSLMNSLLAPKNLEKFNPELQAEIIFGQDNSMNQKDIDEYLELLKIFLEHGETWENAEEGILSIRDDIIEKSAEDDSMLFKQLFKAAKYEVKMQYCLWKKDYLSALSEIENILKFIQEPELKGYRGYWNYLAGCCAYEVYKGGEVLYEAKYKDYFKRANDCTIAINWFNVTEDVSAENKIGLMQYNIERIEKVLIKEGGKGLKNFHNYLDDIMRLLNMEGIDFERGHQLLGYISGYISTNPTGTAEPDPIWIINREICIVAEDKIYNEGKKIPPNDVKEAAGHELWVRKKYESLGLHKDARIYTVFITTANDIQDNTALFGEDICYLRKEELCVWAQKLIEILKQVYRTFSGEGDAVWREETIKLFKERSLTPEDFIEMINKKHLKDL